MKTTSIIAIAAILTLAGCSAPKQESAAPESATAPSGSMGPSGAAMGASGTAAKIRLFPMHGKIISVDAPASKARIDAGPIGDWMGAMTMNYGIKDDAALAKLKAGNEIDATANVDADDNVWLTDIKVLK